MHSGDAGRRPNPEDVRTTRPLPLRHDRDYNPFRATMNLARERRGTCLMIRF